MAHGSLSQFKADLARKKDRDSKRNTKTASSDFNVSSSNQEYVFPKVSDAELEKIKSEMQNKMRSEQRKVYIISGFVCMVLISIVLILILI